MKEVRFFYVPDASVNDELPEEEAAHAVRVLRLGIGDELMLMDGEGTYYEAVITEATKKRCFYRITKSIPQPKQWSAHLHLAMAPTKNMDRTEWLAEKATEIGFDELTFIETKFSERKVVKTDRIDRILVSAMKQSHKATKPMLNGMTSFRDFIHQDFKGGKYICHCYGNDNEIKLGEKHLLRDVLVKGEDALVMIGPEGDFSVEEVAEAEAAGFVSVSLGESRLRTETAALVAVHMMSLFC